MSAVEAAAPPPRPPLPTFPAMTKEKKKSFEGKKTGFSMDLESVDFDEISTHDTRKRSLTLGSRPSRPHIPSRQMSEPHVIDSSGRSPKVERADHSNTSSVPVSKPNRPPPPQVTKSKSTSAFTALKMQEPQEEDVSGGVIKPVLRRRLSSEGSAEGKVAKALKRLSSPRGSREVSPLPQLPEDKSAGFNSPPPPPSTVTPTASPPPRVTPPPPTGPLPPPPSTKRLRASSSPPPSLLSPVDAPVIKHVNENSEDAGKQKTPRLRESSASPSHPNPSPTAQDTENLSPNTDKVKFGFPSDSTNNEPTPVIPPRPFRPPRPFPAPSNKQPSKRSVRPSSKRPVSAPSTNLNMIHDKNNRTKSTSNTRHTKRNPKNPTRAVQEKSHDKSHDKLKEDSSSSDKKESQSINSQSSSLSPPRSPSPTEKAPEEIANDPQSPLKCGNDSGLGSERPSSCGRSEFSPEVSPPSSLNSDVFEDEGEEEKSSPLPPLKVGGTEGAGRRKDIAKEEEGEQDVLSPLAPSNYSPSSKGKKFMKSVRKGVSKSFMNLRKTKRSPELDRQKARRSTEPQVLPYNAHSNYPDPLPQGPIHPLVVKCVAYLNRDTVLVEEGLFRIPGDLGVIRRLREDLLQGYEVDLMEILDPHTVAGLLKLYLREKKASLIPRGEPLTNIMTYVKSREVEAVRLELEKMEVTNFATISMVMELLAKITAQSSKNFMTSGTLATSCGPSLFPYLPPSNANQITKFLIDNCDAIFKSKTN